MPDAVVIVNATGLPGSDGWSPVIADEPYLDGIVQYIADWVGGTGDKPEVGQYIGPDGLVDTPAEAVNIAAGIAEAVAEGVAEIEAAGTTQVGLVNTAGSAQVAAVNTAGTTQVGLVQTEGATQLAAVETAGVAGVALLNTTATEISDALGLAGGTLFDVVGADYGYDAGLAITDVDGWTIPSRYFSFAGVPGAVIRAKVPGADFSGETDALRIWEVPTWPFPMLFVHNAGDLDAAHTNIPNTADPDNVVTYSGNIYPYAQSSYRNNGSTTNPAVSAPTVDGTRLTWSSTAASFLFIGPNANNPPQLPAGTYVFDFVAKQDVMADQAIRLGSSSSPSDLTAQTVTSSLLPFSKTITTSGSNYASTGIFGGGSNQPNILVDQLRFYKDAVPPTFDETRDWVAVRRAAIEGGILTNGNGTIDLTTNRGTNTGGWMLAINDDVVNFSEITVAVAIDSPAPAAIQTAFTTEANAARGTTTSTLQLGLNTTGSIRALPDGQAGVSQTLAAGIGPVIIGLRVKDGETVSMWNDITNSWDGGAFAGFDAQMFHLFGHSNGSQLGGSALAWAVSDVWADQGQWEEICNRLRHEVQEKLDINLSALLPPEVMIASGDSRTQNGGTIGSTLSWARQLNALNEFGGTKTLPVQMAARSGDTTQMQASLLTQNNPLDPFPYGTGGVQRQVQAIRNMIRPGQQVCRPLNVWGPIGVNNSSEIIANPSNFFATVTAPMWAAYMEAFGGPENMIVSTEIVAAIAGWEAARLLFNDDIRDWCSDNGVTLVDNGADAILGNPASVVGTPNTYYDDEKHPSGWSHTNILKPSYKTALVAKGV